MMHEESPCPGLAPLSGGKAASLVVLLHGVAANGDDILSLGRAWRTLLPEAEFVAPDAPFACDYAPQGRQWFSLADRAPEKLLAGLRQGNAFLQRFLDALLDSRQLADSRLALAGFSQGAAMALYAGLRRQKRIAGIAAFSGALPMDAALAGEIRNAPPVLLVHGEADDVVPFRAMAHAKAVLAAAGAPVEAVARPGLGHAIDEAGVAIAGDFLCRALGVARSGAGQSS